MSQGSWETKSNNFDNCKKFIDSSINEEMRLIDLANPLYSCYKRYCINTSKQKNNGYSKFICPNQLMS